MSDSRNSVIFLPWDSEFFGLRTGRILSSRIAASDWPKIISDCEAMKLRCVYWLADSAPSNQIQAAYDNHFKWVDLRLEMRWSGAPPIPPHPEYPIRPARPTDLSALQSTVEGMHKSTRFGNDPNFEQAHSQKLYSSWVERDLKNHSVAVWSDTTDIISGFISYYLDPEDINAGIISLVAVTPSTQGQGIGSKLVDHALVSLEQMGARTVSVVTQGTNIGAQRTYQKAGFRTYSAKNWFHRWFGE